MPDPDTSVVAAQGALAPRGEGGRSPSGKFIKTPKFTDRDIDSLLRHEEAAAHHRRYQVEGLIGVGATGEVFAVMDGSLERLVAIKLLRSELATEGEDIRNFIDEARITAKLSHPNVLPVHDLNLSEDGRPYFSMSRISGKTLGQMLLESEKGVRSPGIASMNAIVNIFIAICNAVNYAHHFGIIHQDIKPDNVLIGDFGEILLLDWGSAARIDGEGKVRTGIYGTPLYMSPEQARQEYSDVRSDIYCIGSALFHALLLRIPSWSEDGDQFWEMKQQGTINLPTILEKKQVPAELLAISCKAIAASPLQRYQTVLELRRDLEQYQSGLAVSAHRETFLRWIGRIYSRNRNLFWTTVSALIIVGILLTALIHLQLKQRGSWLVVFQEHFDEKNKDDLANHWIVRVQSHESDGAFQDEQIGHAAEVKLLPNVLQVTSSAQPVNLVSTQEVRGNFRVTWDGSVQLSPNNLNCFIGSNRSTGFTFHIGGWGDSSSVVLTEGAKFERLQEARLENPLSVGKVYHFALEREERHLRLRIDGHLYIDYLDAESIGGLQGQTFGFDCFINNRSMFSNIQVYHQAVAQIISPVDVGDKLFMLGNWLEAERQYKEISEDYPGSDLDLACRYRIALCEHRLNNDDTAAVQFDSFAASHPEHELAPYALYQRFQLAVASSDERTMQRILRSMSRYRGNAVLGQILDDLGRYRLNEFKSKEYTSAILYDIYPKDTARHIEQVMVELRFYSDAFAVSLDHNPFPQVAASILEYVGEHDQAWKIIPWDVDMHAASLNAMGRYQEALMLPCRDEEHAVSLIWMGRLTEVTNSRQYPAWMRSRADLLLGDLVATEGMSGTGFIAEMALRQQGRYSEFLARHPKDEYEPITGITERERVLVATGQTDEALKESTHLSARAYALLSLGRVDEAVKVASYDGVIVSLAAINYLQHDQPAKAAPLLDALATQLHNAQYENCLFMNDLMPEVIFAIQGDRDRAEHLWQVQLATKPLLYGQSRAAMVKYVLGLIDDSQFMKQPRQLLITVRLLEAQALKQDYQGHVQQAAKIYQQILLLDQWKSQLDDTTQAFMEWRVQAAGMKVIPRPGGNCLP